MTCVVFEKINCKTALSECCLYRTVALHCRWRRESGTFIRSHVRVFVSSRDLEALHQQRIWRRFWVGRRMLLRSLSNSYCWFSDDSHLDNCHQARSQGGNGGNCPPPIPKVALTIFWVINLLMCKPKKCVSANQPNCLKNLFYFNFSRTWSEQYGLPIVHD